MIIQTKRLVLRPFYNSDKAWYYDFVQDAEIQKRLPGLASLNKEKADNDLNLFVKGDFYNDFYYVITDDKSNVVGVIIAVRIMGTLVDVSYYLKREYRHKGYMHEALEGFFTVINAKIPDYRFRLIIDADNEDSLNVAMKFDVHIKRLDDKYLCYL